MTVRAHYIALRYFLEYFLSAVPEGHLAYYFDLDFALTVIKVGYVVRPRLSAIHTRCPFLQVSDLLTDLLSLLTGVRPALHLVDLVPRSLVGAHSFGVLVRHHLLHYQGLILIAGAEGLEPPRLGFGGQPTSGAYPYVQSGPGERRTAWHDTTFVLLASLASPLPVWLSSSGVRYPR